jgi:hypothetical protein
LPQLADGSLLLLASTANNNGLKGPESGEPHWQFRWSS